MRFASNLKHGQNFICRAALYNIWSLLCLSHCFLEVLQTTIKRLLSGNTPRWFEYRSAAELAYLIYSKKLNSLFRKLLLNVRGAENAFEIHPGALLIFNILAPCQ
jgi:hypothetical protein